MYRSRRTVAGDHGTLDFWSPSFKFRLSLTTMRCIISGSYVLLKIFEEQERCQTTLQILHTVFHNFRYSQVLVCSVQLSLLPSSFDHGGLLQMLSILWSRLQVMQALCNCMRLDIFVERCWQL